ncbi:hypothetical protein [Phycicoccus avicenniae]|uniref:hypothetical protein n=1 Tax=Phycicoccus avicenniae TaxID=2828860 RepID=UPI003D275FD2
MPEPTQDGHPTRDAGSSAAADTGYSEWISEVRRLYVEPKGPAELHFVEDEPDLPEQPARGRGRLLGRGRRSSQAAGAAPTTEPLAAPAVPVRPSLADLMAGGTAPAETEGVRAGAPVAAEPMELEAVEPDVVEPEVVEPDVVEPEPFAHEPEVVEPEAAAEVAQPEAAEPEVPEVGADPERRPGRRVEWPSLEGDASRPAFEPWAVVARREPASAEGEPATLQDGDADGPPVTDPDDVDWPVAVAAQDEGWPVAAPAADLPSEVAVPSDVGPSSAPSPEQAWVAALADAHDAALTSVPAPRAVEPDEDLAVADAPVPTHSWWDEGPLDETSADPAGDGTPDDGSATPAAAPGPSAVDLGAASRSSWFDETPDDELADEPGPVPATTPTAGEGRPDPSPSAAGALPPWPTRAPGDPLTRREDPSEAPVTRAQTRAAARRAARRRAARRRWALVAAVVLLVVVAAGWWVLRPDGAAAAGASPRPDTAAVTVVDRPAGLLRS